MKFLMTLLLATSITTPTYATINGNDPSQCDCESDIPIALYLQDLSIVYNVLGASKFYMNRCGPLSTNGVYYRELAIKLHDLDMGLVQSQAGFQEGWMVAASYPSCRALWDGLDQLGIGFLFSQPE